MDQGGHGGDGELPFEAEPDIDHDAEQGQDHGHRATGDQLGRNGRPDDLGTAIFHRVAERLLHLGDGGLLLLLLRLRGDADQNRVRRAEFLDLDLAETKPADLGANVGEIGGALLGLNLKQGPALEIDTHVEADRRHENEGDDRQEGRDEPGDGALTNKVDLRVRRDECDATKHSG